MKSVLSPNRFILDGNSPWWRHQMETFSALLVLCAGNSPVPVNSPHKGQWRGALMFSLICAWINDWVNNREAGDLRRYRGNYDVNATRPWHTMVALVTNQWIVLLWLYPMQTLWRILRLGHRWHVLFISETRRFMQNPSESFLSPDDISVPT